MVTNRLAVAAAAVVQVCLYNRILCPSCTFQLCLQYHIECHHGCGGMSNFINMIGRGKVNYFCLNWTSFLLFAVLPNNILLGASTLVPVSKVQLLRGEASGVKLHERNGLKTGGLEERLLAHAFWVVAG